MFRSFSESSTKETIDLIIRLAYIAELKEWDNRTHLERIRRYTYAIVSEMGMTQQDVDVITMASMLHDIGKSQLPDALLGKTGNFDKEEWAVVEAHTSYGATILSGSSSPILQTAEIIALTHHERWNGTGYPGKLKKDEIPMTGRIVAVADVFDALTTPRPYKQPVDPANGLKVIQEASGTLFDPLIVQIFSEKFNDIMRGVSG
jgi:putative two-component system response regulator